MESVEENEFDGEERALRLPAPNERLRGNDDLIIFAHNLGTGVVCLECANHMEDNELQRHNILVSMDAVINNDLMRTLI